MPEYSIPGKESPDFQALDEFTQGYIEAMFWTEEERLAEESENLESSGVAFTRESGTLETVHIPGNVSFELLAPESLDNIIQDCKKFQGNNKHNLQLAYTLHDYSENQAGIDFWLSRNGHGTGYFDRELGGVQDDLQEVCRTLRGVTLYLGDDGKVYTD